jgi:hypothetical protein
MIERERIYSLGTEFLSRRPQYKTKQTPFGKPCDSIADIDAAQMRFVALAFILGKAGSLVVNAILPRRISASNGRQPQPGVNAQPVKLGVRDLMGAWWACSARYFASSR